MPAWHQDGDFAVDYLSRARDVVLKTYSSGSERNGRVAKEAGVSEIAIFRLIEQSRNYRCLNRLLTNQSNEVAFSKRILPRRIYLRSQKSLAEDSPGSDVFVPRLFLSPPWLMSEITEVACAFFHVEAFIRAYEPLSTIVLPARLTGALGLREGNRKTAKNSAAGKSVEPCISLPFRQRRFRPSSTG